jgi:hypothetical protein
MIPVRPHIKVCQVLDAGVQLLLLPLWPVLAQPVHAGTACHIHDRSLIPRRLYLAQLY